MAANSATFPQKLHELISEDCNHDIIRWVNGGKAFKVVNAEGFEHEIVPKYFRHTKLTSFQRQLNLYGFRRMNKGEFQGAYFHNNFVENRKDLLVAVKRASTKGNKEGHHSPILTDVDGVNSLAQLLNSGLAEDGGINMDAPFDGHVVRPVTITSSSSSSSSFNSHGGAAQFQSTFVKRQKVSHQYADNGASYVGSEGDDGRGSSAQNQQQRGQSGGHQQYQSNQNQHQFHQQQYPDDGQGQYGNAGNIYDMNHPQYTHGGGYGSAGPPTSGPSTVSDGRTSNNNDSSRGGGSSTSNNQSAQQHASDNTSGSGGDNPRGFPRYPKVQPPDNANGLPNNARMSVPTTVPLPPHPFLMGGKNPSASSSSSNVSSNNNEQKSSSSGDNGNVDNNGAPTIQIPPPPQHRASNRGGGSSSSRSTSSLGSGAGHLLGPPMTSGANSIMPHLFREISANTQDELRTLLLPGPDSMEGGRRGGNSMLQGGNGGPDSIGATFLDSMNSNSSFLDQEQDQETGSFAASASAKGYKPNLARTTSDGQWGPAVDIEKSSSTSADAAINNLEFTDGDGGGIATSGIAAAGTSSTSSSSSGNNGIFSPSGKARPPLQDGSTPQKDGPPSSASRRNNALEMLSVVAYQRSTSMEGEATPNSGHAGGLGGIKSLPQAKLQMNVTNAPLDAVEAEANATDDLIWGKR